MLLFVVNQEYSVKLKPLIFVRFPVISSYLCDSIFYSTVLVPPPFNASVVCGCKKGNNRIMMTDYVKFMKREEVGQRNIHLLIFGSQEIPSKRISLCHARVKKTPYAKSRIFFIYLKWFVMESH